jgi:nucleoside-diphosphate-sugar epimerase
MRVVVTGATGNVGTSVVSALVGDPNVTSVLGLARRRPDWSPDKTTWQSLDVAATAYHLHLIPASPNLLDLALHLPIMDTTRSRTELGWMPTYTAVEAVAELLEGTRTAAGLDTPPLSPRTGGPARIREFLTGVGGRP